jgi:hypothetical protein
MLDEVIKRVRQKELPWNDIRNMAVLRRTQRAMAQPRMPRRSWRLALAPVCLLALCIVVWRVRFDRTTSPGSGAAMPSAAASVPATETVLRLADGSVARGGPASSVHVDAVRTERAELVQTAGTVHYDVVHRPERTFVVTARDVVVIVLGTAFDVEISPTSVAVRVDRGNVEVVQHERHVVLEAGEGVTFDSTPSGDTRSASPSPVASIEPPPLAPQAFAGVASPAQLLERADQARREGDLEGAASSLRELLQKHPSDTRGALAEFLLGRVESARGAHREAARAFAACLARKPSGSLAEDGLAELARARARSGDKSEAVAAARRYLATYPGGVHDHAMKQLVDGAN